VVLGPQLEQALAYPAPFVVDRLVKDRVTDTPEEAEELFTEAKRYLVLCEATPEKSFGMHSAMVDQAWHAFILFTSEYADFGHRFFGTYLHHSPVVEHDATAEPPPNVASFADFQSRYEELFGHALPSVWFDDTSIATTRRVVHDSAETLTVGIDNDLVELIDSSGAPVLSVNALAADAVTFIAQTPDFYVRELPGGLTDEEKVGLVQPLVRSRVLRLAP
jgi:hypothetical protein